jgi:hypothetical protein
MKRILATLLIMLPVMAKGQQDLKGELVDLIGMCVGAIQFAETMTSYGEIPFVTMITMRPLDKKMEKFEEYPTVLFVNPDTRTWTLAEKRGNNKYCVTGVGENAAPYIDDSTKVKN